MNAVFTDPDACLEVDLYVASYGGNLDNSVSGGGTWC